MLDRDYRDLLRRADMATSVRELRAIAIRIRTRTGPCGTP
jgi:hypothetical protein